MRARRMAKGAFDRRFWLVPPPSAAHVDFMRMNSGNSNRKTPPATLAEFAARLEVSPSTVSKALAGDPHVAAATRERVRAAARSWGFQKNRTAALLAKRRHTARSEEGKLHIAYLSALPYLFIPSIFEEAGVLGTYVPLTPDDDPARVLDVLWNRGVAGLLIAPEFMPWRMARPEKLPWRRFSVVKLARVHPELPFHLVRHDAFDFMMLTLRKATERAKRRIAVLLWESESESDNLSRLGATLAFRERLLPSGLHLEWRYWKSAINAADPAARDWLLQWKPDVVVLYHWYLLRTLELMGLPEDFQPYFCTIMYEPSGTTLKHPISGCNAASVESLRRALGVLLELIARGERGFARHPNEYIIEPEWIEAGERPKKTG